MARIRTIKPEFPQSESMGRVSRDARLLFIMLWTLCDDSGRTRGNSRMLASLLFPYDDDAPNLLDGWIGELEREGCVVRYQAEGSTYLQVCNWLNHQKIDKPSPSKIPEFDDSSRILANPRERSSEDQGSRIKDQGGDQGKDARATPRFDAMRYLMDKAVHEGVARDWLTLRKQKRAPATETAIHGIEREAQKAGLTLHAALTTCCQRGWQGFKSEWIDDTPQVRTIHDERKATIDALTGRNQENAERDITGESLRLA